MRSFLMSLLIIVMPMLAASEEAKKPELTKETIGSWVVICLKEDPSRCEIVQQLSRKDNGQQLVRMGIAKVGEKKQLLATAILPLGIALDKSVSIGVDENAGKAMPVKTCTPAGCIATFAPQDADIKQMKKGKNMKLKFATANGQPIELELSLKGFTKAYGKI